MAKSKKPDSAANGKITHTIAKEADGTIQVTFSIPYDIIKKEKDNVVESEIKNVNVPGFRKGMAPKEVAEKNLPSETVIQKTLSKILPDEFAKVVQVEKLSIAMYPKYELLSANENEPWQVRAMTCKLPEAKLGNYEDAITSEAKSSAIWTPGKEGDKKVDTQKKELSQNEKESLVLKQILKTSEINIPNLLIEEDVNDRLANLLDRIEKLGLNLDSYLASVGKTPEGLREEYKKQSQESISLEIALNMIADKEKIEISESELEDAIKASSADPAMAEALKDPQKKQVLSAVLRRQKVVQKLTNLISSTT